MDIVKKAFANPLLKKCVLVDLLGGEPLLCKDLVQIVKHLRKNGFLTNLSTNGLLLPKFILDLKMAGITRINVSVYPTNLVFLKKELIGINKIFQVHNSYVLTRSELEKRPDEIIETVRFLKDSGSKSLRFWMFRPLGENADLTEIVTEDLPAYKTFYERGVSEYKDFILWPTIQKEPGRKINISCRQLWQRMDIDSMGNVGTCCGPAPMLRSDVNFFSSRPNEIWNHQKIIDLRKKLLENKYNALPEYCKNCNILEETGW